MMLWLLSFLFCTLAPALTFDINTTPICSVYTPHSILKNKEHFPILFVGGKPRYSTCTGAVWFHEHYLAVLNLYGQKINTYRFYAGDEHFEPLQEIDNAQGAQLTNPENLVVSRDGSLLATCLGGSDRGIRVYSIDTETHLIQPKPIVVIKTKNLIHGIRFTPDDKYLATVGWDNDTAVCVYKIVKNAANTSLQLVYQQANKTPQLRSKGIVFTKNGRFAIVVCSMGITNKQTTQLSGLISVYHFNAENGSLGNLVCSTNEGIPHFCYEDMALADDDTALICSDQNNNALVVYPFNPSSGQLSSDFSCIQGDETQLSFSHGMGLKPDGKYLVVANNGDDKFNLYCVK